LGRFANTAGTGNLNNFTKISADCAAERWAANSSGSNTETTADKAGSESGGIDWECWEECDRLLVRFGLLVLDEGSEGAERGEETHDDDDDDDEEEEEEEKEEEEGEDEGLGCSW